MSDKWKEALGELAALDKYRVAIPELPIEEMPLPEVSVESRGEGRPRMGAVLGRGDFSVEGGYQKRDDRSPPEWSARLGYRRRF
jgi:hypothetical protein